MQNSIKIKREGSSKGTVGSLEEGASGGTVGSLEYIYNAEDLKIKFVYLS